MSPWRRCLLAVAGVAAVAGRAPAADRAARDAPQPSRPAGPGCAWEPIEDRALGVRLLVQRCTAADLAYVFSFRGNALERHRLADDRTLSGPHVLEVFTKPPDERIEEAIHRLFVDPLGREGRKGCRVVRLRRAPPALGPGKLAFTIAPAGKHARRMAREKGPRDLGCGAHGRGQQLTYFEYHPAESRARFAFVAYGWETESPPFDERSITFLR